MTSEKTRNLINPAQHPQNVGEALTARPRKPYTQPSITVLHNTSETLGKDIIYPQTEDHVGYSTGIAAS